LRVDSEGSYWRQIDVENAVNSCVWYICEVGINEGIVSRVSATWTLPVELPDPQATTKWGILPNIVPVSQLTPVSARLVELKSRYKSYAYSFVTLDTSTDIVNEAPTLYPSCLGETPTLVPVEALDETVETGGVNDSIGGLAMFFEGRNVGDA